MDGKGERLDTYLVAAGYASGREKAKEIIEAGYVLVNGAVITKASRRVADTDVVVCAAPTQKYVGRGGYKLERAIEAAGLTLTDAVVMDVGRKVAYSSWVKPRRRAKPASTSRLEITPDRMPSSTAL